MPLRVEDNEDVLIVRASTEAKSAPKSTASSRSHGEAVSSRKYERILRKGEALLKWEEYAKKPAEEWTPAYIAAWKQKYFEYISLLKDVSADYHDGRLSLSLRTSLIHIKDEANDIWRRTNQTKWNYPTDEPEEDDSESFDDYEFNSETVEDKIVLKKKSAMVSISSTSTKEVSPKKSSPIQASPKQIIAREAEDDLFEVAPRKNYLNRFLNEISKYPVLSAEKEIELARKIRQGDRAALDEFVESNLRMVAYHARKFFESNVPIEDLICEGVFGLIKAAEKWDETRGFRFYTYATWWVRQAMLNAITEYNTSIHISGAQLASVEKINRAFSRFEQENEREPSAYELAEELDLPVDKVAETLGYLQIEYLNIEDQTETGDLIRDCVWNPDDLLPDARLLHESFTTEVIRALNTLTPRENEIVRSCYGIGCKEVEIEVIAEKHYLTRERVRQIREKATRRLRSGMRSWLLREYLGGLTYTEADFEPYSTDDLLDDYTKQICDLHEKKILAEIKLQKLAKQNLQSHNVVSKPTATPTIKYKSPVLPSMPKPKPAEPIIVKPASVVVKPIDGRKVRMNASQEKRLVNLFKFGKSVSEMAKVLGVSDDCIIYNIDKLDLERKYGKVKSKNLPASKPNEAESAVSTAATREPLPPMDGMISAKEAENIIHQPDYKPFNMGKSWPTELPAEVTALYKSGHSIAQLMWKFGRSEKSIVIILQRAGVEIEQQLVVPSTEIIPTTSVSPVEEHSGMTFDEALKQWENVFAHTSSSYKYLWALALVDHFSKSQSTKVESIELAMHMLALAWKGVLVRHLNLGRQDGLSSIIVSLHEEYDVDINADETFIRNHFSDLSRVQSMLYPIINQVAYRFLSPWIKYESNQDMANKSKEFINECVYSLSGPLLPTIAINPKWHKYIRNNRATLLSAIKSEFEKYLHKQNPDIQKIYK